MAGVTWWPTVSWDNIAWLVIGEGAFRFPRQASVVPVRGGIGQLLPEQKDARSGRRLAAAGRWSEHLDAELGGECHPPGNVGRDRGEPWFRCRDPDPLVERLESARQDDGQHARAVRPDLEPVGVSAREVHETAGPALEDLTVEREAHPPLEDEID